MTEETRMEIFNEEREKKTFEKVFNRRTIELLHKIANRGTIERMEHIIKTGKEGQVYEATAKGKTKLAVKIYKLEVIDFKNMQDYIKGDNRFEKVKKNRKDIIYAWTKKEFRNLKIYEKNGIRVPKPIYFKENILIMEYIGDEEPAPTIKDNPPKNMKKAYEEITKIMAQMINKAELVHADLSQYNILNDNEKIVIIDCGQAIPTNHPKAEEFFKRDVENMSNYFKKQGIDTDFEKMKKKITEQAKKIKKDKN